MAIRGNTAWGEGSSSEASPKCKDIGHSPWAWGLAKTILPVGYMHRQLYF